MFALNKTKIILHLALVFFLIRIFGAFCPNSLCQAQYISFMGKGLGLQTDREFSCHPNCPERAWKTILESSLGTALKDDHCGCASHAKGIVLGKGCVETKQTNSAIRKRTARRSQACVINNGCLKFIEENG